LAREQAQRLEADAAAAREEALASKEAAALVLAGHQSGQATELLVAMREEAEQQAEAIVGAAQAEAAEVTRQAAAANAAAADQATESSEAVAAMRAEVAEMLATAQAEAAAVAAAAQAEAARVKQMAEETLAASEATAQKTLAEAQTEVRASHCNPSPGTARSPSMVSRSSSTLLNVACGVTVPIGGGTSGPDTG
jgi:hypothetical protein